MASKTGTLQDAELKTFLSLSRLVVSRSSVQADSGLGLLSSPSDGVAAFVDTRALCAAIVALSELSDFPSARALGTYLLALQRPTGAWEQRYDPSGNLARPAGAEDVTAMSLWALMTYIRASGDEALSDQAREGVEEAVRYTRARSLNPYLNLVETTVSLHGPGVSEGFDLWNNCAHASAFALCHRVYGGAAFRRLALHIRRAIGLLMTSEGRFLRRLDPRGYPDGRADVALIAPHYFGLWAPTERMVMNSADLVERALWNVEFGGYIRYLPFSAAERSGLFGPSPRFAAWMAQYHYELGNKDRAEAIMRWQFDNAIEGELAEVLVPSVAASRYLPELRGSLSNGSDGVDGHHERLLEELDSLEGTVDGSGVIPTGAPSVWAHMETLRALRRGGYVERWQLGTEASRAGEGPESTA
jgi:GH15 family glucan-1,4-alpha-glucosidase